MNIFTVPFRGILRLRCTGSYQNFINISTQLNRLVTFNLRTVIGADWHLTYTAIIALWIYLLIYSLSCSANDLHGRANLLYHKTTSRQLSFTVVDISKEQSAQHD